MEVGDKRWKFVGDKLHCIVIDSMDKVYTHFHYEGLDIDDVDHWAETVMVECTSFESEEEAIQARLNKLYKEREKLESKIYETRQMLLPYIRF